MKAAALVPRLLALGIAAGIGVVGRPHTAEGQEPWRSPDPALVERARRILASVPFVEGHNDLPSRLLDLEDRGDSEAGADLEDPLARSGIHVAAKEPGAGLRRLHALRDAEYAAAVGVEQNAVVHYAPCTFLK